MTNPNDSVYPKMNELLDCDDGSVIVYNHNPLTKREYFAALAMQGYLSNIPSFDLKSTIVFQSVKFADALIEALNTEQTKTDNS